MTALNQHKVRTLLTTLGVIIAVFLLICSVSVGRGVYVATMRQFRKGDSLRQIQVMPDYAKPETYILPADLEVKGEMSDAKRARLRERLIKNYNRRHPRAPQISLSPARLKQLAALDHVQHVIPSLQHFGQASYPHQKPAGALVAAMADNEHVRNRLVAGDFFASDHDASIIVGEYLLYRWGLVGDNDVGRALGKKIKLTYHIARPLLPQLLSMLPSARLQLTPDEMRVLDRLKRYLPEAQKALHLNNDEINLLQRVLAQLPTEKRPTAGPTESAEFTIVGVVRETTKDDDSAIAGITLYGTDADLLLPVATAENFFLHASRPDQNIVPTATVVVDHEDNLRTVIAEIEAMGLRQWSLASFADRVKLNLTLILFVMTFLAGVALLVSALGITNTMFMSVLERTREIGIMKAVGGRNLHVQAIFLVEGGLIGVVGGAIGLLLSWIASYPGNSIAQAIMERQTGAHLHQSLFLFPLWLTLGVPLFAVLVTTLAAYYPARRASHVNPITALRHE